MRISKKFKSCFVCCLPARIQVEVKRAVLGSLRRENVSRETMKELTAEAMASRVNDLTETIEIEFF